MDAADRAIAWHHERQAQVCDLIEPWEHGTILRSSRYPSYYDFNLVRVEDEPGMNADELADFADEALGELEHRRVDFDRIAAAEPVRPRFDELGWKTARLIQMRMESPPDAAADPAVREVPYDEVEPLRATWHEEDFPGQPQGDFEAHARAVSEERGVLTLAYLEGGEQAGFAALERVGDAAEVTQVYVRPERRGAGLGTALTSAAIAAAGQLDDLWIVADDEERAKNLYARLGFRPVWTWMEATRWPRTAGAEE